VEEKAERIKLYLLVKAITLGILFLAINFEFALTTISVIAYVAGLGATIVETVIGLISWHLLRRRTYEPGWIHLSLAIDLLVILVGLYFSGGPQTTWGFLPVIVIVMGGYLFDLTVAAAYGLASLVGIAMLFGFDYWGILPHQLAFNLPYYYWSNPNYLTDYFLGLLLLFVVASVVSGYVSQAGRRSAAHMKEVLAVTVAAREA
jgi:hypothetical protein